MEETLFKLARAIITDTGEDTVSSKGGIITYRITSLKRKLVNGKVVSTSTPYCTLGSASVSWAAWEGVTVGDGYLDVNISYSENTGPSRSTTLIFTQIESDNKIHLTVTQTAGKITVNITLSLSKKDDLTGICNLESDRPVASDITFRLRIRYGVSTTSIRGYTYTLVKGSTISRNTFTIQKGVNPRVIGVSYSPQEDSEYIYKDRLLDL